MSAIAACRGLFLVTALLIERSSAFSPSHRFRKSTLTSWDDSDHVELGHCIEEYGEDVLTCRIRLTSNGGDYNNEKDSPTSELALQLPEKGGTTGGGGLASVLWSSALASSILLASPEFRSFVTADADGHRPMNVVELGSGRGLAGLVAAWDGASCLLTDNDPESIDLLRTTVDLNQEGLKGKLGVRQLDWRDNVVTNNEGEDCLAADIVLGSDIAYYFHLLRPIMDTAQYLMEKRTSSVLCVVGQANRESQWDLYKNIRNGCYNQRTDERDPPWAGSTSMVLYNLKMSMISDHLEDCEMALDGVVPIAVLLHQESSQSLKPPFQSHAHVATDEDDESILKSF